MTTDVKNADRRDPLRAAVCSSSAEARAGGDVHPSSDLLLAYHDQELADGEAEAVREHLALCAECACRALDLEPLSRRALAEDEGLPSEEEAWQAARRALDVEGLLHGGSGSPAGMAEASWLSREWLSGPRLAWAAAAVLLLTTVGLSLRLADAGRSLADAGRSLAELERVRANVPLLDLHPLSASIQRAEGSPPHASAAAGGDLVLILHLLDPGSYARYRLAAFAAGDLEGQAAWSTDALERSAEGDFTVLLPPRLVAAGDYRIRLYGIDGERADLLGEYALRLGAR